MTFAVEAEFESLFGLIEQIVPGVPGCANITGYLEPYALQPACEWASVSFPVTAGGTYYVFVAPQFTNVFLCGSGVNDYVATLTGEACICGDFDGDGDVDYDDFYFFLDAFGTCVGDLKYEEVCDFDGDECITLVDYQMWSATATRMERALSHRPPRRLRGGPVASRLLSARCSRSSVKQRAMRCLPATGRQASPPWTAGRSAPGKDDKPLPLRSTTRNRIRRRRLENDSQM